MNTPPDLGKVMYIFMDVDTLHLDLYSNLFKVYILNSFSQPINRIHPSRGNNLGVAYVSHVQLLLPIFRRGFFRVNRFVTNIYNKVHEAILPHYRMLVITFLDPITILWGISHHTTVQQIHA